MGSVSAIGIDLGTTYSCVGALDSSSKPFTVVNSEGDLTTPSVVFFDRGGVIVGKEAAQAGEFEPERLAQFFKRDMGEAEYSKEIHGISLPPEVLQGLILRKLKQDTELKLGPIKQAVITVPAFFNEPCRKATMDAGRLAGLEVLDIINEPTAAAITYGVQKGFLDRDGRSLSDETILVYDLGGGTFDVTLMRIDGVRYEAIATAGDVYLGGIDWDRRIADEVAERFLSEHQVDPREDPLGLQRLLQQAREVKHALTAREQMNVFFRHNDIPFRTVITRAELEDLTGDLLDRTMMTVRDVMRDTGMSWSKLSRLLVVGGSSRMPMVTEMLARESGLEVDRSLSPDEAIAHGAAVYAGLLQISDDRPMTGFSITNVNSHDLGVLGIESATGRPYRQVMIPRNTPLPSSATKPFKTAKDGQRSVKVEIVEGGDDGGFGATQVGKCSVRDLPPGLKAGTAVEVSFDYATNGRLTVRAFLPSLGHDAVLTLDRVAGLPEEAIQEWLTRIDNGLTDELLHELSQWGREQTPAATEPLPATDEPAEESPPLTPIPPQPIGDNTSSFPGINTGELPDDGPEVEFAFPNVGGDSGEPGAFDFVDSDSKVEEVEAFEIVDVETVEPVISTPEEPPVIKKLVAADHAQPVRKLNPQAPVKKLTPIAAPRKLAPATPPPAKEQAPTAGEAPPAATPAAPPEAPPAEAPPAASDWKSRRKKLAPGE